MLPTKSSPLHGTTCYRSYIHVIIFLSFVCTLFAFSKGISAEALGLEKKEGNLYLTSTLDLKLPALVENAARRGLPLIFIQRIKLLKKRWYWRNKILKETIYRYHLSYIPLTRQWRVQVNMKTPTQWRSTLNTLENDSQERVQTFHRLVDALVFIQGKHQWFIAPLNIFDTNTHYFIQFYLHLDTTQLLQPMQIGVIGEQDWEFEFSQSIPFTLADLL